MIFKDILIEKGSKLSTEIDNLFSLALNRQNHFGNLLLIYVNGFYDPDTIEFNKNRSNKLDPHVIGLGMEGHSEQLHYKFIHKFRTTHISQLSYEQYLNELKWTEEKKHHIDKLIDEEETTIQLEMLIYLKIWEADMFIKKLYELVRILQGADYDWYFRIANSARDTTATGSRQNILRLKVREPLKEISPILYDVLKNTYKSQIRNSIAHSNYSFLNRAIGLNNYIKNDPASQFIGISFEEWINIFHNTLVLHNEYVRLNNKINDFYGKMALGNGNEVPILITDENGNKYERYLFYRHEYRDWLYKQS